MRMSTPTVQQLQRAISITEQIQQLQSELDSIFSGGVAPVAAKRKGKRTMSPEARERIAAAQRARWAKSKGGKATKSTTAKAKGQRKKRVVSAESKARMAAAAKKRWAKRKET